MTIFRATQYNGVLRPYVEVSLKYACAQCSHVHEGRAQALVDSGATHDYISANLLPDHVAYDSLPELRTRVNVTVDPRQEGMVVRLWRVQLRVLDVLVATELRVGPAGSQPPHLILGLNSVFRHFAVAFAFSNQPPLFSLQPVGQLLEVDGPAPSIEDLPLVDWGGDDGAHYLQIEPADQPLVTAATLRVGEVRAAVTVPRHGP